MAKILLVEDDQLLSSVLAARFRDSGHEVLCAFDGDSGIEKVEQWKPDLMVLDILLPGKDGFEVLSAIRDTDPGKALPVIVVSNLSDEKSVDRMKQLGVSTYMVKAQSAPQSVLQEIEASIAALK